MIKAEEEQHLGNRSHDTSHIMFKKLQNNIIEREAEMDKLPFLHKLVTCRPQACPRMQNRELREAHPGNLLRR